MMLDESFFEKFGVEYSTNEIIFCEYEPGYEFYFIQSGKVKIVKLINNRDKTMDVMSDGDIFGEMSILEEAPRSASAIAITHVKLLKFHRDSFDTILEGNPEMAYKLLMIFSKRIYEQKRRLMILLLDEPRLKVMDVMVMLADEDPHLDLQNEISLDLTPQDIAGWAGISEQAVQKELARLKQLDKIEIFKDRIQVRNIRDFERKVASKRKNTSY